LMAKASAHVAEDVSSALKRLVGGGRAGMGQMFKVLGVSEPNLTTLAGFADEEPAEKAETP
jgi:NADH dehydrogenase [ubiquinone] 1 alpha subcomplex assembly factor 7